MITYAKAVDGGEVDHARHIAPPTPPLEWEPPPGEEFIEVLNWPPPPRPDPHSVLFIQAGIVFWCDPRMLVDVIADGIAAVDAAADRARSVVVGDALRVKEHDRAQRQAEAFRAAGFSGAPPFSVACWATAKGWPPQVAAEDILAAADRDDAVLDGIRALRLHAREDIRRANDNATADAVLAAFAASMQEIH